MNAVAVQADDMPLWSSGVRYFGDWGKALRGAGLNNKEIANPRHREWTEEKAVAGILQRRAQGLPLNYQAVKDSNLPLWAAACKLFGNWSKALHAAGLEPVEVRLVRRWTDAGIIRAIRKHHREKKKLNSRSMMREDAGLWCSAIKRFGSWNKALERAGIDASTVRRSLPPWNRDSILRAICDKAQEGEPLNCHAVRPRSLTSAACRFFGSWDQALRKAGLNPDEIRLCRRK